MTEINHHIPDHLIRAYASGSLEQGFSLVVAAHVSLCDACRAQLEAEEIAGGTVLEALPVVPSGPADDRLRETLMQQLDRMPPDQMNSDVAPRMGIYPGPVARMLDGKPPRWRPLGGGIRQTIIHADREGSARLLWIPPGVAVPDHGHRGLEMTLVLQGSFHDETGTFATGDVEVADASLDHTPIAGDEAPCICLAATDAPLKFHALLPRLLQTLFRI